MLTFLTYLKKYSRAFRCKGRDKNNVLTPTGGMQFPLVCCSLSFTSLWLKHAVVLDCSLESSYLNHFPSGCLVMGSYIQSVHTFQVNCQKGFIL